MEQSGSERRRYASSGEEPKSRSVVYFRPEVWNQNLPGAELFGYQPRIWQAGGR